MNYHWATMWVGLFFATGVGLFASAQQPTDTPQRKQAEDIFTSVYAPKVAAAKKPAETLALAKELLEAAKTDDVTQNRELLRLVVDKAMTLAGRSGGRDVAEAAANILAKLLGEDADQAAKAGDFSSAAGLALRAMEIARPFANNDLKKNISQSLRFYQDRLVFAKQIDAARKAVERNPKDTLSRQKLVRLLVVEVDKPSEAKALLDDSLEEAWRIHVPLAIQDPKELDDKSCLRLGQWYQGLSAVASPTAKDAMLQKARLYSERFLELHLAEDADRVKARLILKQLRKTKIVDLLGLIDPAKHAILAHTERWTKDRTGLMTTGNDRHRQCLGMRIPYELPHHFVLRMEFSRTTDAMGINMQREGKMIGVRIYGNESKAGILAKMVPFDQKARNLMVIQADDKGLTVTVNGKLVAENVADLRGCEGPHPTNWDGSPFGINVFNTPVKFFSLTLETLE